MSRDGIAAALFDLDGTLVDTMPLHHEAYRRAFAEHGAELSWEAFRGAIGGTARETIPRLLAGCGLDVAWQIVHARKRALIAELFATADIRVLDTAKLVPVLARFVPVGVVSSGARGGIELLLARLGWTSWFAVCITGEDVARGKPDPEPFARAAAQLGVAAARCLAFEDTDAGVASATAAGMEVIDVRRMAGA